MNHTDQGTVLRALTQLAGGGNRTPHDAREAAVALLLRGESLRSAELLLMRRAEREGDRWSGHIGLPGGHVEDEDADLVATARRESREEVGVDPGASDAVTFGALPSVQASSRGARLPLYVTPIVFHRLTTEDPELGPEADEAFWLPIALAQSGDLDAPYRFDRDGVIHKLPSWEFEGRTIWGMTHGIISRFLSALDPPL